MSWLDFYLVCLIAGVALSVLSFLLGTTKLPDFPHQWWGIFHGIHAHGPFGHGHHWSGQPPSAHGCSGAHGQGSEMSPVNFSTLMVFLAWFGGAGFLLTGPLHWSAWMALPVAAVAGVLGAYVVYFFVARVLMARDHAMRPLDYSLPGTLASVTLPIRRGGTGEITYVQGGTRRSAAARADDAIANGVEVIVIRFEEGIAYVRRFQEGHAFDE